MPLPKPAGLRPIKDLRSLELALDAAVERLGTSFIYWRGHGNGNYPIVAGAFRGETRERSLILHFMQRAASRRESVPSREAHIDWLLLAQHYGLPTRLLDWSRSALTALFFAVERHDTSDGCLYALNPSELNAEMVGGAGIIRADAAVVKSLASAAFEAEAIAQLDLLQGQSFPDAIALAPIETDLRMLLQTGVFTLHGNARDLNQASNKARFLLRFNIRAEAKPGLRWTLQRLGISRSALFPDLESLAAELKAGHE